MKTIGLVASVFLLLAGMVIGWLYADYRDFLDTPLQLPEQGHIEWVKPGDHPPRLIRAWSAQGFTEDSWRWRVLLRQHPLSIRAGEFLLPAGTRPREALEILASDEVVQYAFTLIEGWSYRQLSNALLAADALEVADPQQLAPEQVMAAISSDHPYPEGWFLPETYHYVRGDTALDILRRAHQAMRTALERSWQERVEDLPLDNAYELLTLASIVEKETAAAQERARVAGVFVRRLQQRWRLETDPTVIYGLGEAFDGNLRRVDLQTDTPYNTYTRFGLPPTPIAMPGVKSLQAAARPKPGTAMFFVADGNGGHVFSDTLAEHNRAVRAWVKKQTGKP